MRSFTAFLSKTPAAWVSLANASWLTPRELELLFMVRSGRSGRKVGCWRVRASGLREFSISDVNGGGLQLSGASHPVVRQYLDPTCVLEFSGQWGAPEDVWARLCDKHLDAVDDWIPVDRYLPTPEKLRILLAKRKGKLCRGPKFLVQDYAAVLRHAGMNARIAAAKERPGDRARLKLLHFGNSYVVAEHFVATPDAKKAS